MAAPAIIGTILGARYIWTFATFIGTGILALLNISKLKAPAAETGFFSSIPLVGWIALIVIGLIILKSR